MGLADEIDTKLLRMRVQKQHGPQCSIGSVLSQLTDEDRTALTGLLADRSIYLTVKTKFCHDQAESHKKRSRDLARQLDDGDESVAEADVDAADYLANEYARIRSDAIRKHLAGVCSCFGQHGGVVNDVDVNLSGSN